jgi:hypothetical protein
MRSHARYSWRGGQPTRCGCCSTPPTSILYTEAICPQRPAVPRSVTNYLHTLGRSSRQWLLLEHRTSRLVEALCLVYRVRYTYSLPLALGVVGASLIPTCPRLCVCSIYSIALVASCGDNGRRRKGMSEWSSQAEHVPQLTFVGLTGLLGQFGRFHAWSRHSDTMPSQPVRFHCSPVRSPGRPHAELSLIETILSIPNTCVRVLLWPCTPRVWAVTMR